MAVLVEHCLGKSVVQWERVGEQKPEASLLLGPPDQYRESKMADFQGTRPGILP